VCGALLYWAAQRQHSVTICQKEAWRLEFCTVLPLTCHFGILQIGEMMAEFPLDPQLAKMLVTSPDFK
jgi:Helicase associated domain (HA2)